MINCIERPAAGQVRRSSYGVFVRDTAEHIGRGRISHDSYRAQQASISTY